MLEWSGYERVKIPYVDQQVTMNGSDGVFVVHWVDESQGIADLASTIDPLLITRSVPFKAIFPIEKGR
jgi:hypothetical protein